MKKLFYFAAMLLCFVSCAYSGDTYRDIDIYLDSGVKGNKYEYTYGEDFHRVFTTSEPVHLINILYTDYKEGIEEEKKEISKEHYEHPPFAVDWEGVRVAVKDFQTIEIWIDADAWPTTEEHSAFAFDLEPIRFWYDDSTIWAVDDIVIFRNQPAEELPAE